VVGIEPASMTAVFCENTADRKAETWERHLAPFDRLEFVVSDAAKGIAKGVAQDAQARRDQPSAPPLEQGLDVFHTTMEAKRVLAQHWRRAEAAWEQAEATDIEVAHAKRQGIDARGVAQTARAAGLQAIASLERTERLESAWDRAHAALDLFDSDGRLRDRGRAKAEIAAAVADLAGPDWSKVRNVLGDPRSLTFLDRMHCRLEAAEPRPQWREAMAWRWWLRHRRSSPPADRLARLIQGMGRDCELNEEERVSYNRVSAVLQDTVRASSAVECMNSVLRMQQSRHKRMTQPMLDLKRLYWNSHRFRSGPRKDVYPYQRLGLKLPSFDFWELLQTNPVKLSQRLSTLRVAE
jgi:hypothetical protein